MSLVLILEVRERECVRLAFSYGDAYVTVAGKDQLVKPGFAGCSGRRYKDGLTSAAVDAHGHQKQERVK